MLFSLLVPLTTVVGTAAIETAPVAQSVAFAGSKSGNGTQPTDNNHSGSGSSNSHDGSKKNKKGSSTPKSSNGGHSSDTAKGNILDQPASEIAQDASKYMTADNDSDDSSSSSSDQAADAKKAKTISLKNAIADGSLGQEGNPNIGNAWSFMSADNDAFWAIGNQSSATYHVTARNGGADSIDHYPSKEGQQAYKAMVEATHLPYIMNELGLDNSFSQGFNNQKHSTFELWGANLMQLFYGLTKFVNDSFAWVLSILSQLNPFNLIIQRNLSGLQNQHFGALGAFLGDIYNGGTKFGATFAAMLAGFGITLAAMGLQVGQSARTSQGRGMLAAGIDLVKRFFIILILPLFLGLAYTDLMNLASGLFSNAGYAPGNYAVYSTMTSFEDMVSHGRLNFSPEFIQKGLLPNEQNKVSSAYMTAAYLNHRSTLAVNADFGRSGAKELMEATNGTDNNSTQNMFVADKGAEDGQASAMNMLRDYAANRTYAASDFASAITPGIPSKNKALSKQLEQNKDMQDPTDLKSKMYSENGNLHAGGKSFTDPGVVGNSTISTPQSLAQSQGGLSTIGMYNYLRSVTVLSKIHESSTYKQNNEVSNPQHFSVNFVGSGSLRYANILFALCLMGSMAFIAVGTLWFIIKALIDAIPGSFSGVIQGAFGSLAGGVRAVGAFFGFFIAFGVTGIFYQLSFKSVVAFISAFESFFMTNATGSTGDTMSMSAIKLFGFNGHAPTQVVGAINLSSAEFTAVTVAESMLMMYIVMMLFKWRRDIITGMSAAINNSISRILQSFGAVTGKGSTGMDRTMNQLAEKSGHSGLSSMYNGGKGMLGMAGRGMSMLSGGRGGAGKLGKDLAMLGAGGIAAGAMMSHAKDSKNNSKSSSLRDRDKQVEGAKGKGQKGAQAPKNAEDARQQAMLQDLAARQGSPLDAMADAAGIGMTAGQQNEMARNAERDAKNAMPDMNSKYSDQGHLQQLSHSTNNAQNHGNLQGMPTPLGQTAGMNMNSTANSKHAAQNQQDALEQVLQAAGDGTAAMQNGQQFDQQLSSNGQPLTPQQVAQRRRQMQQFGQQLTPNGQQLTPQQVAQRRRQMQQFGQQLTPNGQQLTPQQVAQRRRQMQQTGQLAGLTQPTAANSNLDGLVNDPSTVSDAQGNQFNDLQVENGQPLEDLSVDGTDSNMDQLSPQMSSQMSSQMSPQSMDSNMDQLSPQMSSQMSSQMSPQSMDSNMDQLSPQISSQMSPQMSHQAAKQLAHQINHVAGTNLTPKQVQEVTPELAQSLDQGISTLDSIMDGGPQADGTTITATGDGQATISQGSMPGLNSDVSYGKGLGVMPGAVPDGMVVDPAYTSSGAGVIHGGLNTAMSNVQTANANVQRANNAVAVNPGNQILQQRAQTALTAQRTAQTQAMEAFNSTPARQMMGSIVNSNIPSHVTTGQVNKAVNDVYQQQQVFKEVASKYGPTASQTQEAATQYRNALNTAQNLHIKSQILHRADFLQAAHDSIRNQQMSIMNGTFKPR